MQIVIEFPKKVWERYVNLALDGEALSYWGNLIANGTPLPKGHGRLIDADAMYDDFEKGEYDFEQSLGFAPTIIEADNAESEE